MKNVCFIENLYSLLLYLLIVDDNVLDNTFFFYTQKVPKSISDRFKYAKCMIFPKSDILKILYILWLRLSKFWKYPFIKTCKLFGQDNFPFVSPLVGKRKMTLIEDGIMNYTLTAGRQLGWVKGLIGGPMMREKPFGLSSSIEKILLTGMCEIPDIIRNKVTLINPFDLWQNSSVFKRNQIINIFGLSEDKIEVFKKYTSILFTQPLSEDNILSEETKIALYKKIINGQHIAIKPHPREITIYKKYFPKNIILESNVPIELLTLMGIKFKKAYTLFSTSVLSFPYPIEIYFTGTSIHPDLVKKCGNIRYENGHVIRDKKS